MSAAAPNARANSACFMRTPRGTRRLARGKALPWTPRRTPDRRWTAGSVRGARRLGGEAVDDLVAVLVPRVQPRRAECRLVGRVRIQLRFEHEGVTLAVHMAAGA